MKYFLIDINEEDNTGMNAISLVETPAVLHNFLCFSDEQKQTLTFANDEKHIITGVVCLASVPIYRYDESIGEYYVIFTPEVIEKMMLKYSKNNLINNVNLQHEGDLIGGLTMIESYVKDDQRGISPIEFTDVPNGSWLASFKVEDNALWDQIKTSGKLNGFSLLGIFDLNRYKLTPTQKSSNKLNIENEFETQSIDNIIKKLIQ